MLFRTTMLAAAVALALPVLAEEAPIFIADQIVVTPTRVPQKLSDTLAATTVLTRADIEASSAIDLPTLLQGLPGVEISRTGVFGSQTVIRLRGAESDQTLVLVDGLRVNSISTGFAAIEHLSLGDLDRIEIVRGNVSSVYGADAIGGVVRIFTRQGRGVVRPHLNIGVGTMDFYNIHAGIGGEIKPGLRFDVSVGQTQGGGFSSVKKSYATDDFTIDPYDSYAPVDADKDTSRNTHFNFRLSQQINDNLSWGLTARQNRADVNLDGTTSNHAGQDLGAYSAYLEGRPSQNWFSRLTFGRSTDGLDSDLDGAPIDRYRTQIDQILWENTYSMGRHLFRFGVEAQDQQLDSSEDFNKSRRRAVSAFGGVGVRLGDHEVDLSVRRDQYSDFGGHTTGRAAYGYSITPALKIHASVGTAFRAPSFNDLYLDYPPYYYANPNLKSERAQSRELGLNYAFNGQFVQAILFMSETRDMIGYVPAVFDGDWNLVSPATTANIDRARNHGLELAWNGKLAGLNARASFTAQNPEDATTGLSLLRRAQRYGGFGLSDRIGKLGWNAEVVASGPHPDVHVTEFTRVNVPGYATLNLSGDYFIGKDWKLTGRVINVLDAEYSLVHGYATPGRSFRLELSCTPK